MKQKIRVTTKAPLFEKRKQQYLEAGYEIENEQSLPLNGMCSFTVVWVIPEKPSDELQ
jgi:hypothetical protein